MIDHAGLFVGEIEHGPVRRDGRGVPAFGGKCCMCGQVTVFAMHWHDGAGPHTLTFKVREDGTIAKLEDNPSLADFRPLISRKVRLPMTL